MQLDARARAWGEPCQSAQHAVDRRNAAAGGDEDQRHVRAERPRQREGTLRHGSAHDGAGLRLLAEERGGRAAVLPLDGDLPGPAGLAVATERIRAVQEVAADWQGQGGMLAGYVRRGRLPGAGRGQVERYRVAGD